MTELLNEGEFTTAIDIISDKLGIVVTEIFEIYVGAQATIGVISIAIIFATVLTCLISYFVTMKLMSGKYTYRGAIKELEEENTYVDFDDKAAYVFAPLIVVVVTLCISTMVFDCIGDGILRIICPEYSAITEIINIVKP